MDPDPGNDEDQVSFREPHRGARRRIAVADLPGDLDLTLDWQPETDLTVARVDDEISDHALIGRGGQVHVIPASESWPVRDVKSILKNG